MEIEWTDADPDTGAKRTVRAAKFARAWTFRVQGRRYEPWVPVERPTRDMWETLLDALERRYPRREGVTDDDLRRVRAVVAALPPEEGEVSPQRGSPRAGEEGDDTKGHKEDNNAG